MEEVIAKLKEIDELIDETDPDFRERMVRVLQVDDCSDGQYIDSQGDDFYNNQFDSEEGEVQYQN